MKESGFIPEDDDEILYDIDEVRSKNNIVQVASELGLNVNRSTISCIRIDKHKMKNGFPTMTLNPLKNTFRCWVCNDVKGDVVDLVMQVKNIDRKKAVEFLAIRAEIKPKKQGKRKFKKNFFPNKEVVYSQVIKGINNNRGIDLIGFTSLKGGTGKSLIVNNLAFSFALLFKFISNYRKKEPQKVELIDLDFGKPDQRLIIGIEPKFYIEDILYNKKKNLGWNRIKEETDLDALQFVSPSPVRKSQNLFYFHKNEIIYLINDSDSKIKLADFGGGMNKDILDFLHNIHAKIFVITSEETSKQAIFYLMLTMIYYQLKSAFSKERNVLVLLEKLRECNRTGFRIDDLRFELEKLDEKSMKNGNLDDLYKKEVLPIKVELGLPPRIFGKVVLDDVRAEIEELKEKVMELIFKSNNESSISYNKKLSIYKRIRKIVEDSEKLDSYVNRLNSILSKSIYGLVVNKTNSAQAWEIQSEFSERINHYLSQKLIYLGNLRESKSLVNISNYRMPYVIYNPEDDALEDLYHIGDNILSLKRGSIANVICNQKEYIREIKSNWGSKH
ncbi:MAG: hypothetical protein HWN67_12315 [Candidatus Helarchaeota archaeon]|nr:hypothetical protein [Candidatus Helarchaeota archaeon]